MKREHVKVGMVVYDKLSGVCRQDVETAQRGPMESRLVKRGQFGSGIA
jgi:hypothetical protein